MSLTTIDKALLSRRLASNNERLKRLEAFFKGVPLGTVRFADAAITNAKIASLSADKITTGNLIVQVGVGSSVDGSIVLDGEDVQIRMSDDSNVRLLIGDSAAGFTVRVSLAGTDADESSPDARDYALLADQDNILIKEQSRGTQTVSSGGTATINHGLGYKPHFFGYTEVSAGVYKLTNGYNIFGPWRCSVDDNNLYYINGSGASNDLRFFIFYDDID